MLNRRADKLELIRIAEAVALEKSIDKELIIGSMENGIAKAAKSKFGTENEIVVNINRDNGFVSLKYIFEKIGINADLSKFVVDIPNLGDYKDKAYGVVFDLPLAFFEFFFDIDNTRDAFLFRHLINFILFFISTVVFFILCNQIFQDKVLSLIGSLSLILSPRIFAESFYNPKDIIFMSLFI